MPLETQNTRMPIKLTVYLMIEVKTNTSLDSGPGLTYFFLSRTKNKCEGFLRYGIYYHDAGLFCQFPVTIFRIWEDRFSYNNTAGGNRLCVHAGEWALCFSKRNSFPYVHS